MKKTMLVLASVILIAGSAISYMAWVSRDIPPPDVSDLARECHALPLEDNAYTYFTAATNTFYWPCDSVVLIDFLHGRTVLDAEAVQAVEDLISKNKVAFSLIEQGAERQRCVAPRITRFDTLIPYLGAWRNMGRALAVQARFMRMQGDYSCATDACVTLLRFGELVQQDAPSLLHHLIGIVMLDLAFAQAQDLVRSPDMPSSDRRRLENALASMGPFHPGLIRAFQTEFAIAENIIDDFAQGRFTADDFSMMVDQTPPSALAGRRIPRFFFQPNRTKKTFANVYRDLIENARRPYNAMELYGIDEIVDFKEGRLMRIARPNAVGRNLYALMMPAMDSLLERKCRAECDLAATRLLASLHAYRADTHALPQKLSDLVPDYIDAIPLDPFDGQEFRYNPRTAILYSVGRNGTDFGGSSVLTRGSESDSVQRRRWNTKDVVYEINAEGS